MKISNRLKTIASFVEDDSYVFDVGCDHALLDIFLVQNKKNIKVVASDINPNPLKFAENNIALYGVSDKVQISLGNGLTNIPSNVDTIIISGLGGLTINDVFKRDIDKLVNIKTIILSPHSDIYSVRKYVTSIGYKIVDEILLQDQKKIYTVIKFNKGQASYTEDELLFGPSILQNKTPLFYQYYQSLLQKNKKIIKKIPKTNKKLHEELENINKRLDEVLKV